MLRYAHCADSLECFTPIPLEKQRNSFSNFENTPAFRAPSAQCGRFVRARRTVSVSRRASVGTARACGARVFYVRCTSARMTRGITVKSAPKYAQICAPAQFFEMLYPNSVGKQRNRFRILKIHPLFAHRRRNAEDSSAPDARFPSADAHPSAQRGYADNLRSGHIRARDNRESVPKSAQIYALREIFENFKKISFSVQTNRHKISCI